MAHKTGVNGTNMVNDQSKPGTKMVSPEPCFKKQKGGRISMSGWDCPSLTIIYPGFDYGSGLCVRFCGIHWFLPPLILFSHLPVLFSQGATPQIRHIQTARDFATLSLIFQIPSMRRTVTDQKLGRSQSLGGSFLFGGSVPRFFGKGTPKGKPESAILGVRFQRFLKKTNIPPLSPTARSRLRWFFLWHHRL